MSDLMQRDRLADPAWNGQCPACGGSGRGPDRRGFQRCGGCGTLWVPARRGYEYDDAYPASRAHDDAAVAACKVRTFEVWCRELGLTMGGRNVLEIGFGGGQTLAWMRDRGARVSGVEPVEANRLAAIRAGIPKTNIRSNIADFRQDRFDFAVWLDSFEHETEPAAHLAALNRVTGPGSRALLVLPVADSLSRRMMGRWWPHDIRDHWVFYSTRGLTRLWESHGWRATAAFHPGKCVSARTIARHVEIKTRLPLAALAPRNAAVWLNFGERGLLFERL